jgi:hypothetical protein
MKFEIEFGLLESRRRSRIRWTTGPGPFLFAAIVGLAAGCTLPKTPSMMLPEEPIAFMHWSGNEAKKRFNLFGKAAELPPPPPPPSRQDPSVRQDQEIRAILAAEKSLSLQHKLAKTPGRLMLFWPRTGEVTKLKGAPLGSRPLAWSADHTRLLFSSAHRGQKHQLYELDLKRQEVRVVTTGPDEHPRGDYAKNDQVVVLKQKRSASHRAAKKTIHLRGPDGRLGGVLAEAVPPGTLRITPDGERLIYDQVVPRLRRGGATRYESMIAMRRLEEEGPERLLVKGREPTLTPNGEWVVFASPSAAGYRLRRMRTDGSARIPINPGGTEERMPSASPDGQFIVFVKLVNGYRRLAVRRFDGKHEMRPSVDGWSEFPVW